MRKLILLIYTLNTVSLAYSQIIYPIESLSDSVNIAKNEISGDSIRCYAVDFGENISTVNYDSIENVYIVAFDISDEDHPGRILLSIYSSDFKKIKWQTFIGSNEVSNLVTNNYIFQNKGKKCYALNIKDGSELWEMPSKYYTKFNNYKIGLTYRKGAFGNQNGLCAYKYLSESPLWCNENIVIPNSGFNHFTFQKDSVFIFFNDKLYGLNIFTGQFWKLDIQIVKYVSHNSYENAMIFGGGFLGAILSQAILPKKVSVNHSNYIEKKNAIVLSGTKELYSIGFDGQINWRAKFPENLKFENASLYYLNDKYILINHGQSKTEKSYANSEKSMIISFDSSGQLIHIKDLKQYQGLKDFFQRKSRLNTLVKNKSFFLLSQDKIAKFSPDNLELDELSTLPKSDVIDWSFIEGEGIFITEDHKLFRELDSTSIYLADNTKKLFQFDQKINLKNEYSKESYFTLFYSDERITVLTDYEGIGFYILNKQSVLISKIRLLKKIYKQKGVYTFALKNSIVIINENQF